MSTTTRMTFEQFQELPETEGAHYELDEGELLMESSPALRHNLIRQNVAMRLKQFVDVGHLGLVVEDMDFRLGPNTIRNPDVAFISAEHAKKLGLDCTPVAGAPALAVEVISPSNRADDMTRKTHQYLSAGIKAVWIVYPSLRLVEVHLADGVQSLREPATLNGESLLDGFTLSLPYIFDVG